MPRVFLELSRDGTVGFMVRMAETTVVYQPDLMSALIGPRAHESKSIEDTNVVKYRV